MKQLTAYKFRIYPDVEQERLFRRTAGSCRLVYNLCLEQRKMAWNRLNPTSISYIDQHKELKALKAYLPYLKEVPHHCLQQAVIDLQKAYVNFFKGRAAYPKPRKKFENESFRFPDPKQIFVRNDAIFLPKAKWVKMVMHRPIIGTIKNATVSTSGDHWYVAIQVEQEVVEPVVGPMVERSMDLGVVKPICMDDGEVFDLPRMSDKEKKKEATLQQRIARRKTGSKNQFKAKRDYRRFKAKITSLWSKCHKLRETSCGTTNRQSPEGSDKLMRLNGLYRDASNASRKTNCRWPIAPARRMHQSFSGPR